MSHTLQDLEAKSDSELEEIVALVQGWGVMKTLSEPNYYINRDFERVGFRVATYHPTQPSESGESQCFKLMVKYGLTVYANQYVNNSDNSIHSVAHNAYPYPDSEGKNLNRCIVIAAILSAQGGE